MKKLVASLSKVATIVALIMITSTMAISAATPTLYCGENGNIKTIYSLNKDGKTLSPKIRYEYKCNEQGEKIAKYAYRWNNTEKKWAPYFSIRAEVTKKNTTLYYGEWNKKTASYNINNQKSVYYTDQEDQVYGYSLYKMNPEIKKWEKNLHGSFMNSLS